MRATFGTLCLVALVALGATTSADAGYTTYYSDISTFSGYAFANGGAGGTATAFGNTTTFAADDITAAAGSAGGTVNSISFSVGNLNSTAVSANAILQIYDGSGTNGGPGNLLAAIEFNPISFTAGTVAVYTYTSATSIFTMPSGLFWAGLSFTSTTATTAQLNELGEGIYSPPTVGSSQDAFFLASSSSSILSTNPAGGFEYFGGSPVADFGFAFSGNPLSVVPEPSSVVLMGLAGLTIACGKGFVRSRRAKKSA